MIRFIIAVIFVIVFLICSIPLFLAEWILGKISPKARDYSSRRIVQWAFNGVLWISGVKVTVIGEENIPDEPVLYVGNHRSLFDIPLVYVRSKRLLGFVSKDSMAKIPLLSTWMRFLYCLFLNREDVKEGLKTILQAIEYVKQGVSICIFPEGTRNKGEELTMLPFKEGAFKIATKTGCPIIPVSMNGTENLFERQFPRIKKGHIVMEYGKPIYPNKLEKEDLKHIGNYCQKIIQETIKKNATLL